MSSRGYESGSASAVAIMSLVLALIVALGWIFWQNFIFEQPVQPESEIIVVKQAAPDTSYLTIAEWGVKLPIVTANAGAIYKIKDGSAILSTQLMTQLDPTCGLDGSAPIGGSIVRGPGSEIVSYSGMKYEDVPGAKMIGDFYYFYVNAQATCADTDTDRQLDVSRAFRENFIGLTAVD